MERAECRLGSVAANRPRWRASLVVLCGLGTLGCDQIQAMRDQPKLEPMEASEFFEDGTSARPLVDGVVIWAGDGPQQADSAQASRPELTLALLERGRARFDIFCSVCHGRSGYADGMVVRRGYPTPASFHTDRLRSVPDEHMFHVITNGLGKMPAYRHKVQPPDRWAIIAYVRALQFSQHAAIEELPAEVLRQLDGAGGESPDE
jgi:mono/diheme cytochrome c family protein